MVHGRCSPRGTERGSLNAFVLGAAMVLCILVTLPVTAQAAAPEQLFRVEPVKVEITVAPGETTTRTVRIIGQGAEPMDLAVKLVDYYVRPDSSFVFSAPGHESYSCARWVTLPANALRLRPGEVRDLPITIHIPDTAEPGGHFACILFSSAGPTSSIVNVNVGIGTLLLVTVTGGEVRRGGDVSGFAVRHSTLGRTIGSELVFQNTGNVHVSVIEEVTFADMFGKPVGKVRLDPETILPGAKRYLRSTWTAPYFGWFTARATARYGPDLTTYNVQKASSVVGFWVVSPEALLVLAAFLLIAIAVTRSAAVHKRRRDSLRRDTAPRTVDLDE